MEQQHYGNVIRIYWHPNSEIHHYDITIYVEEETYTMLILSSKIITPYEIKGIVNMDNGTICEWTVPQAILVSAKFSIEIKAYDEDNNDLTKGYPSYTKEGNRYGLDYIPTTLPSTMMPYIEHMSKLERAILDGEYIPASSLLSCETKYVREIKQLSDKLRESEDHLYASNDMYQRTNAMLIELRKQMEDTKEIDDLRVQINKMDQDKVALLRNNQDLSITLENLKDHYMNALKDLDATKCVYKDFSDNLTVKVSCLTDELVICNQDIEKYKSMIATLEYEGDRRNKLVDQKDFDITRYIKIAKMLNKIREREYKRSRQVISRLTRGIMYNINKHIKIEPPPPQGNNGTMGALISQLHGRMDRQIVEYKEHLLVFNAKLTQIISKHSYNQE